MTGYAVYHIESPNAARLLRRYKITTEGILSVVDLYRKEEGVVFETLIGISKDGIIGTETANWRPDLPDAYSKGFICIPWAQALGLLRRIPKETVAAFFEGTGETKQ